MVRGKHDGLNTLRVGRSRIERTGVSPKVPLKLYGGEYMLFTERRIVLIRSTTETQTRAAVVDGSMIVIPEKKGVESPENR